MLCEALDRISRDQEDVARVFKRLRFAGIFLITLVEGEISELHVGLKGTVNALFLKDLAMKTHCGIRGRIEAGKNGGGNAYGYRVVRKLDAQGEPIRGNRATSSGILNVDLHHVKATAATTELLERIGGLYAVEEQVRGQPPDVRLSARQSQSKPQLAELR